MPGYDEAAARSVDQPAFSNGTEGDAWQSAWCWREGAFCMHDDIELGGNRSCPLIEVALLGATPAERTSALGREMYVHDVRGGVTG